jgi:hypothetical protein
VGAARWQGRPWTPDGWDVAEGAGDLPLDCHVGLRAQQMMHGSRYQVWMTNGQAEADGDDVDEANRVLFPAYGRDQDKVRADASGQLGDWRCCARSRGHATE